MRKNWHLHETTYDCLIEQLKKWKRLDEGSLLDWLPIYFITYLFALIVFLPLTNQFTTGISLLFVLIYAIVAYILAATYVFFYKNYIVTNIGKSIIIFRNLSEKDGLSKNVWKFRVDWNWESVFYYLWKRIQNYFFLKHSDDLNTIDSSGHVDIECLKAILQQCKELGWLN